MNTPNLFDTEPNFEQQLDDDQAEAFEIIRKHLATARALMATLLRLTAEETRKCSKCDEMLYFVRHRPKSKHERGALTPYTVEGINHFTNCPSAEHFRRRRAGEGPR